MAAPSTLWQEKVGADETARHAGYARDFEEIQARKSARYGKGRALHRKQQLGLAGSFEVLGGLPEYACYGAFAVPRRFDAWVRLSNGGPDRQADHKPDVRGFAIKLKGVVGPGALGAGDTEAQDFLLINHPAFAFAGADEFVGLAKHLVEGPGALLGYLVRRYGVIGAMRMMGRLGASLKRPFSGFASENFYSAAPIACGPYAARVRLLAASSEARKGASGDWAGDVARRLMLGPLSFDFQLQFFVDEKRTPVEDASVDWPEAISPYVTVGRLTLPPQDPSGSAGRALATEIEAQAFDPWITLADHRPLGEVMRARKVVYYQSQQGRR